MQYLDKVVDDFFVQFIEVEDVPVTIQRRVLQFLDMVETPVVVQRQVLGL